MHLSIKMFNNGWFASKATFNKISGAKILRASKEVSVYDRLLPRRGKKLALFGDTTS